MAVRLNALFRREEDHRGRRGIGDELRNRFGFSLIQAPLRKTTPWATDQDLPQQRMRHSDGVRTTRPLETIDLTPLLRGRIGSRA